LVKKSDWKKAIILIVVILTVSYLVGTNPVLAIEIIGANSGLRVSVDEIPVQTDDLAPGDTKTSTMTIYIDPESETSSLPVWIRAEIVETVLGLYGGNLDDKLNLTVIHENGKVLHDGPVSKFNKNVEVGYVHKGEPVDLTFTIHLPGESTGNEYQGASMKVKWIITTQYTPPVTPTPSPEPTPTPGPSPTPPPPPPPPPPGSVTPTPPPPGSVTPTPPEAPSPPPEAPPEEDITPEPSPTPGPDEPDVQVTPTEAPEIVDIEDEETPAGASEPEKEKEPGSDETELIIIQEEELPKGLPKTGEVPPIIFFGLGAGVLYAGITLNRKKNK